MIRAFGRALLGAGLALVALSPRGARADTPPSIWDTVREPGSRAAYALHVQVEQLREGVGDEDEPLPNMAKLEAQRLDRARDLLISQGALTSKDVRLRFDLGEIDERLERHEEAIQILNAALAEAPKHPGASSAWLDLAYAHAKLDHPREERAAYEAYLKLAVDDRDRMTAILNLAEANMRDGRMEDAVAGYREAARLSFASGAMSSATGALAEWGLAVALDRSGDPTGAAQTAHLASGMDPRRMGFGRRQFIEDLTNVFFIPKYERLWYLALGENEDAKTASVSGSVRRAAYLYRRVEEMWALYLDRAEHAVVKDRWIALAKAHKTRAHADRIAAEARAVGVPRSADDEMELPPVNLGF